MGVRGLRKPGHACLLASAMLAGCGGPAQEDPRTAAPLVQTALAQPAVSGTGSLTGVVGARVESDLGFRVGGHIAQRLVDAGQVVRRGQPLMRLDATDLALGASAQARVVESAAARLELARRDEQRMRPIFEAGFASRRQYDAVRAALDAARADHAAAIAQSRVAGNNATYAVLRADADGVVAAVLAEPGQVVAAGQPVLRLAQSGAREAIVAVPEGMRATLGTGANASVYGMPGPAPARLRQLSAQADPATRTFEARYVLLGAAQVAPLGSTVTVTPTNGKQGEIGAVSVPSGALYDPGTGPGVWVVSGKDSVVHFRRVHLVQVQEERITVDSGLRAGESVVALGAHLLHEGDRVRVRP